MSLSDAEINAGAQILSQGVNVYANSSANKKTREWNEKMYGRQRSDALADWSMQNQYNSPAAQMERLKAAGLNPNLVYGNGATQASSTVRSSEGGSYRHQPAQIDFGGILLSMYELQRTQAQTNLLKEQKEVMIEERRNKGLYGDTMAFDLGMKGELRDTSLQYKQQQLKKLQADTSYTLNQDERQAALTGRSLIESVERVLSLQMQRSKTEVEKNHLRQSIKNLKTSRDVMIEDLKLKKAGIQPHDTAFMRKVQDVLNNIGFDADLPERVKQKVKDAWKYRTNIWEGLKYYKP